MSFTILSSLPHELPGCAPLAQPEALHSLFFVLGGGRGSDIKVVQGLVFVCVYYLHWGSNSGGLWQVWAMQVQQDNLQRCTAVRVFAGLCPALSVISLSLFLWLACQ